MKLTQFERMLQAEVAKCWKHAAQGDWFAGCVPLACLGHDDNLREVLKMLFWLGMGRDLAGLEATHL